MNQKRAGLILLFYFLFLADGSMAALRYVSLNSANPVAPFVDWNTAATNIQDAIDAASTGDQILVSNGVYRTGGKVISSVLTNRIAIHKTLTVQSVNGPESTTIQGAWDTVSTNGDSAVRCVWITNNARLIGFTLRGGATRIVTGSPDASMSGGGVYGNSTNATADNCVIIGNFASYQGGGAYQVSLTNCTVTQNQAVGSGTPGSGIANAGSGGGAASSDLRNCVLSLNYANQNHGGGAYNSKLKNCLLTQNSSFLHGGAAYGGALVNCTIVQNISSGLNTTYGGAVNNATATNCIIRSNVNRTSNVSSNYLSSTLAYCCSDPVATGAGNIAVDPLLVGPGGHIAESSTCRGAGLATVAFGTDIDGQSWNSPPSIGMDEWRPQPVLETKVAIKIDSPAQGLALTASGAGQTPFSYFWSKDGVPIQDDGHYTNSESGTLLVRNWGPFDRGEYQVVITNASGSVTSAPAQFIVRVVDATNSSPLAPFTTWATAAQTIQDAIEVADPGDVVLVTNGTYSSGGKVMAGDLTNRVALDKAITLISVNGYADTIIEGARDTTATNGPGAVRCSWLANGAALSGFTLQNGATRATGGSTVQDGGGIWCTSTNAIVSNCLVRNNSANNFGGGIAYGTLNNSLVLGNRALSGGGAYSATLNNCTVANNYTTTFVSNRGAGTFGGSTRNSIVVANYGTSFNEDNYGANGSPLAAQYFYCCTSPTKTGNGNINVSSQFLDSVCHIPTTLACYGAGSALYSVGNDLDGEPWNNPPSIGCDEIILSNLIGPLSAYITSDRTNLLVNHFTSISGRLTGRASRVEWSFADGPIITNLGAAASHRWTDVGDYNVQFTAFNSDYTTGVTTNLLIHVLPINSPPLENAQISSNQFMFQFQGQVDASYTVQYTTNLSPPVSWQQFQFFLPSTGQVYQIKDPAITNGRRFFRVWAQ